MKRSSSFTIIVIISLIVSLYPIISTNSHPVVEKVTNRFDSKNLINYDPGTYLIHNNDLQDEMIVVNKLMTIDYTIIQLDNTYSTISKLYPNRKLQLNFGQPSSKLTGNGETIQMEEVWNAGYNGSGVIVGIVDTGVDFTHPALEGKKYMEKSFHKTEYGFSSNEGPVDINGHGTSVASSVVGYEEGELKSPAYGAKIVNAKIGLENGFSTSLSVIAALDWAISIDEIDIVSMSLSEPEEGFSLDPLERMMNIGTQLGKIMLSSAGNSGTSGRDYYQIGSPSSSSEAISVGATTQNSNLAYFSSEGPTYGKEAKPDLLAVGTSVKVAYMSSDKSCTPIQDNYCYKSGTSFSTPLVAGAIASLVQASQDNSINVTPGQIKAILAKTATNIDLNPYQQGFGEINITAALQDLLGSDLDPIIGPQSIDGQMNDVILPLNTEIEFPLTFIGFPTNNISINSETSGIHISQNWRYMGNTSILELSMLLTEDQNQSNLDLTILYRYHNGSKATLSYNIPILTQPKPDFLVLLDLKHTLFDTLTGSTGNKIERIEERDIRYFVDKILDQNGWVTEFMGQELSSDLLSDYDILWMPSAFVDVSSFPYDHAYTDSVLNRAEMFAIYQFVQNGGNILTDFGGTSIMEGSYTFSYHQTSIKRLEHILGIQSQYYDNSLKFYSSISSGISDSEVSLPTGRYELSNGIPTIHGLSGYSGLAKIKNDGGSAYIHSGRNWREPSYASSEEIQQYFSDILSWLSGKSNISNIELKSNEIIITADNLESSDNIQISVNGENIETTNSLKGDRLTINGQFEAGDQVFITISSDKEVKLVLDEIIPMEQNVVSSINTDINEGLLEINLTSFENQIDQNTIQLRQNNMPIDANYFQTGDSIVVTYYNSSISSDNIEDYDIAYIDKFGRNGSLDVTLDLSSNNEGEEGDIFIDGGFFLFSTIGMVLIVIIKLEIDCESC